MTQSERNTRVGVVVKQRVVPPRDYDVIMYNDDVTSMDFVVDVLMEVYAYTYENAVAKMLEIDASTCQVVGCYPKCVAEFKIQQTECMKQEQGFMEFRVEMKIHD